MHHQSTLEIEEFNSDTIIAVGRHYGQMLPLSFDQNGQPRYMLGPHYLIFMTTLLISLIGQIAVLIYLYFFVAWYYLLLCIVMTIFFCYQYIKVGFSVPGIASSGMQPDYQTKLNSRYCVPCKIVRQAGTKHCYECDVCIYELDHHCPWVGKCVGRDNLCKFKVFLLSVMMGLSVYGAVLFLAVNMQGK